MPSLHIDHLVICVSDLEEAGHRLTDRSGLASVPGGSHPGHGTANRIVPLGDSYLELVAVADPEEAVKSAFGNWVSSRSVGTGIDALCLRTDDLDSVCERLNLEAAQMSRTRTDVVVLKWAIAGLDRCISDGLPFFIQWEIPEALHPGHALSSQTTRIEQVMMLGQAAMLRSWIGEDPPLEILEGPPEIRVRLASGWLDID